MKLSFEGKKNIFKLRLTAGILLFSCAFLNAVPAFAENPTCAIGDNFTDKWLGGERKRCDGTSTTYSEYLGKGTSSDSDLVDIYRVCVKCGDHHRNPNHSWTYLGNYNADQILKTITAESKKPRHAAEPTESDLWQIEDVLGLTLIPASAASQSESDNDDDMTFTEDEVHLFGEGWTYDEDGESLVPPAAPAAPADSGDSADSAAAQKQTTQRTAPLGTEHKAAIASGPCGTSQTIIGQGAANCEVTDTVIMGSQIINKGAQQVGAAVIQQTGQMHAAEAMKEGGMAAQYEAAANLTDSASKVQRTTSIVNMAAALVQADRARRHHSSKGRLETANTNTQHLSVDQSGRVNYGQDDGNMVARTVQTYGIEKDSLVGAALVEPALSQQERQAYIQAQAAQKIAEGKSEQSATSKRALFGAATSAVESALQWQMADHSRDAAAELRRQAGMFKNPGDGSDFIWDQMPERRERNDRGGTTTISSGGYQGESAAIDEDDIGEGPDIDLGFNERYNRDPVANGPEAGGFQPYNPNSPGGGGGGGVGGVHTDRADGSDSQGQAEAAYTGGETRGYSQGDGGAGGAYSGGGSRGGGNVGNDSDFLSNLLAQMLPQGGEDSRNGEGILSFGDEGHSRQPASLLARETNIFERIHDTYQKKGRAGVVRR
jgi:hypothetical protein